MKIKSGQDAVMIQYLLGEASEEEQLRLEEQFFADEESYQQLLALEDELKYEYAQGGLTPRQREHFEKRFLASAADRQKVQLAKEVLDRAYQVSAETAALAPAREERSNWWQSLANFFTVSTPAMRFSAASAALLVLLGGTWLTVQTLQLRNRLERLDAQRRSEEQSARQQLAQQRSQQDQLNQQLAQERTRSGELERKLAERQSPAGFLSFILAPGLSRDVEGPKPLVIPAGADTVRLQLDVKSKGVYRGYRAEIQTVEGKQLWSRDVPSAEITVPARLLVQGDYVIVLKGITAQGEMEDAGEYYFQVAGK